MEKTFNWYCNYNPATQRYNLFLVVFENDKRYAAKNIEFEEVEANNYPKPTIVLGEGQAIKLMDELWRAGIRPKDNGGSIGQIGAIKEHLLDLRKILFHKLGMNK